MQGVEDEIERSLLYVVLSLSIGLLVSTIVNTQLTALIVSELWIQYVALFGYALVLCGLAAITYKKQS